MKLMLELYDKYNAVKRPELIYLLERTLNILEKSFAFDVKVSLALVDDREMKQINKKYRNENNTTDVLSFPFIFGVQEDKFILPKQKSIDLGEIIISYPQAKKQAKRKNITVTQEIKILFIHGLLHILGFTHKKIKDRKVMEDLENKIISS